jgi:hypothetical protein
MTIEDSKNGKPNDESQGELGVRLVRLCGMIEEWLRGMSSAERDRMLQVHLAAARGPRRNFLLLCEMTDALAPIRRARLGLEDGRDA